MKKLIIFLLSCAFLGSVLYKIGFVKAVVDSPLQNLAELILLFGLSVFIWRHSWFAQPEKDVFVRDDTKISTVNDIVLGLTDDLTKLYVDCAKLSANIYKFHKEQVEVQELKNNRNSPYRFNLDWVELKNLNVCHVGNVESNKLGIEVWKYSKGKYVAIVFRGTVKGLNSWIANLHWLFRFLPIKNQYKEIKLIVPEIINKIQYMLDDDYTVITTGHSLGGGLAQYANYFNKSVKYTFVFNSSPVTGWRDVDDYNRKINTEGSRIYRLYERGEILQYLRFFMKIGYLFNPRPNHNPYIVEHRLNLTKTGIIESHSIDDLAIGLHGVQTKKP